VKKIYVAGMFEVNNFEKIFYIFVSEAIYDIFSMIHDYGANSLVDILTIIGSMQNPRILKNNLPKLLFETRVIVV
jgi:hypothetical protein